MRTDEEARDICQRVMRFARSLAAQDDELRNDLEAGTISILLAAYGGTLMEFVAHGKLSLADALVGAAKDHANVVSTVVEAAEEIARLKAKLNV